MKNLSYKQLLLFHSKLRTPFEITIEGTSMLPVLHPGERVSVCGKDDYQIGDIIVFFYKSNNLLVHRLLKIENGRFFCKGDNSFRLEDITKENIVGTIMIQSDTNNNEEFIESSYLINRLFRQCGYDIEKTKMLAEYASYYQTYIDKK